MPVYTVQWTLTTNITANNEDEAMEKAADMPAVTWEPHNMEIVQVAQTHR